jgi:hypothetical protein
VSCVVCQKYSGTFVFCLTHYQEYKDQLHEPWVKGLKQLASKERRDRKRDFGRLESLDHIQENPREAYNCEVQKIKK